MRAMIVGPRTMDAVAVAQGFEPIVHFPVPIRRSDFVVISRWLGKVDAVFTSSFRWMLRMPRTCCNARNPGTLARVFVEELEFPIDLFDRIFEEARVSSVENSTRKRHRPRSSQARRKGGVFEKPKRICQKYAALVRFMEDTPEVTNKRLAILFRLHPQTVRRVRLAVEELKKASPKELLGE